MKSPIPANLWRGMEAVGGKLYFEENRMTFKAHAINIQGGETVIPYGEIKSVSRRNTLGFVPNGMAVAMKNGEEFQFVIWGRKKVIPFIQSKAGIE